MSNEEKPHCGNCKYYEEFIGICFCGEAERCADFAEPEDVCTEWEVKGFGD